ncbi:hypothetical protein AVEN_128052-1 [Araneus ventricosus]|uniref:Uncharacterized protein n=1 Tax=Araneus ventricosus TaxID=182803 RepID=A0A4Y2A1C7_ARAVE|nr:hypothetical protein AVEN_128052-1 [Araneus ventricosus]
MKSSLSQNSILLHRDFSENFNCKFAEEIQAIHFGGNRQQVTLHTGPYKCLEWIIVKYENEIYSQVILEIDGKSVKATVMEPTGNGKFKWPMKEDIHDYPIRDIVKKIEPPVPCVTE